MSLIHFFVGAQPHFVTHLAPIYLALPPDIRGDFHVRLSTPAHKRATELGIPVLRQRQFKPNEIVMVAGYEDYRSTNKAQVIFYNHGVGQTYGGDPKSAQFSSYSGGQGRERTILFLCPSQRDADTNLLAYPSTPAIPIGVPYLDQFSDLNRLGSRVVISFHANIRACPETQWAWPWIRNEIRDLALDTDLPLLGHGHPRAQRHLAPWFRTLGIEFEPDWLKVIPRAKTYVIDNSSSGYEAAALGIPTVWLNPPHYRRHINHGLRFWDDIPGQQVDSPDQLETAINLAMTTLSTPTTTAYDGPDGTSLIDSHATQRAVEACQTLVSSTLPTLSSRP